MNKTFSNFFLQEDAHIADCKFNGKDNLALFGVFDGHGGREVAEYCGHFYKDVLNRLEPQSYSGDIDS